MEAFDDGVVVWGAWRDAVVADSERGEASGEVSGGEFAAVVGQYGVDVVAAAVVGEADGVTGRIGMDRRQRAIVTGVHCLNQGEHLVAARLAAGRIAVVGQHVAYAFADRFLVFGAPALGEAEIAEVVETLRSGWITTGPRAHRFEAAFASFLGAGGTCVGVNSGTDALSIAPGIVLKRAAGHTPGSQMVFVKMEDGRELLFLGGATGAAHRLGIVDHAAGVGVGVVGQAQDVAREGEADVGGAQAEIEQERVDEVACLQQHPDRQD